MNKLAKKKLKYKSFKTLISKVETSVFSFTAYCLCQKYAYMTLTRGWRTFDIPESEINKQCSLILEVLGLDKSKVNVEKLQKTVKAATGNKKHWAFNLVFTKKNSKWNHLEGYESKSIEIEKIRNDIKNA